MNFDLTMWAFASLSGLLIGFNKTTGLSVLGIFNVALMSMFFPAKESVGILLPMLIIGDLIAVTYYRRSVIWKHLFSLAPWVLAGILAGYFLLWKVNSEHLQLILGVMILSLIVLQIVQERMGPNMARNLPNSVWFVGTSGVLAGFTTMIGNVAGSVMAVYLLAKRLPKQEFVGTGAWFFLFVNVIKVPFYIQLGMITANSASINAMAVPAIAFGAFLGIKTLPLIPQKLFQWLILVLGAVGAMRLIVPDMYHYFLAWLLCAWAVCLVAGALAVCSKKKKGLHTETGEIYHGAYLIGFLSILAMAMMRWRENAHLLYAGVFAYGLALFGYMAKKRNWNRWQEKHIGGMLGSYAGLITLALLLGKQYIPFVDRIIPEIWLWLLPAIVGAPLIFWVGLRYRNASKVRQKSLGS